MIGGKTLPKEIADQIVERTDGVPLFIEELTKTVIESGILTKTDQGYVATGPMAPLAIPTTLQASLLARLDRLAPTREVVQIAAALGRQFSHELISAATPMPQRLLDEALAQVVSAELIFRRGEPPNAEYTFKHALVQDAAYGTLLRSQRQLIQGRIVSAFEVKFPEIVESQPERLAHHCAEAGQIEKAVGYFHSASRQAFARSAMLETITQARKGIDLFSRLPDDEARWQQELELQVVLSDALQTTRGYTAAEVGGAYTRARELCALIGRPPRLVSVIWGLWEFRALRGDIDVAEHLAEEMRQLGREENNKTFVTFACHMSGINYAYSGDFLRSRAYFEEGLQNPPGVIAATHPRVGTLINLARMLLYLGHLDQAQARYEEGLVEARKSNPFSLALGLVLGILYLKTRGDPTSLANELVALAHEQGFRPFWASARLYRGWALVMNGRPEEGIAEMLEVRKVMGQLSPQGQLLLAEAYGKAGQPEDGLKHLAAAEPSTQAHAWIGGWAEFRRIRAGLHLSLGDRLAAEDSLRQAIVTAQGQQAKFLELLAATDLARLWRAQGKRAEAHKLLAPVYGWFTEGLDTPVLKEAKALLDALGGNSSPIASSA